MSSPDTTITTATATVTASSVNTTTTTTTNLTATTPLQTPMMFPTIRLLHQEPTIEKFDGKDINYTALTFL